MDDLRALSETAVKKAQDLGADEAEAYFRYEDIMEIYSERNEILNERRKVSCGVSFRVFIDKKMGFSYTNIIKKKAMFDSIRSALNAAEASHEDPHWRHLPICRKFSRVNGINEKKLLELSPIEAVELARDLIVGAMDCDKRVAVNMSTLSVVRSTFGIVNSQGVNVEEQSALISASLMGVAKEGSQVSDFAQESFISRTLDLDPHAMGIRFAKRCVKNLDSTKIGDFEGTIIANYDVVAFPISFMIASAVHADLVEKNASPLKSMIGKQITAPCLTMIDDGSLEGGVRSQSFDAEGTLTGPTTIVKNGTLINYIYDQRSAFRDDTQSTGNAIRDCYASLPYVEHTNLVIKAGARSSEQLIDGVKEGVLVEAFSGKIYPENGDFSGIVTHLTKIENGEIKYALRPMGIAYNLYDFLKRAYEVSAELKTSLSGFRVPSVRFENVTLKSL